MPQGQKKNQKISIETYCRGETLFLDARDTTINEKTKILAFMESAERQRHVCLSPRKKYFFPGMRKATLDRVVREGLPGEVNLRNEMESDGEREQKGRAY